jgi:hypothetical protein
MRFVWAAFAAMALAAVPASAQPNDTAVTERELTQAGRWAELYGEALTASGVNMRDLNAGLQALVASGLTPERAASGAADLRKRIALSHGDVARSDAMLAALPSLPPGLAAELGSAELLADARAHNQRMLALLDGFDAFAVAMGKGDNAGMGRALPRILEGSFAMLAQQRLLVRTRQATFSRSESNYQALGVAGQIYRAMEAAFRQSIAARTGSPADGAKAAAALQDELRQVAADTRLLAAEGRRNLAREIEEAEALRKSGDAGEVRLAERVLAFLPGEAKTFDLADRLVAYAEANKAITTAQLRLVGPGAATAPLTQLERDYLALVVAQAGVLAAGE